MFRVARIVLSDDKTIAPGNLTVAIGPNNGGKSRFLKDISSAIASPNSPRKSVRKLEPSLSKGLDGLIDSVVKGARTDSNGQLILDTVEPDLVTPQSVRVVPEVLSPGRNASVEQRQFEVMSLIGRQFVAYLTTESRLELVKRKLNRQQHIEGNQSPIEAAYSASSETMGWINDLVGAAFQTALVLDDTVFAAAEFRLSAAASIPADRAQRHAAMQLLDRLDDQGDGIRSFCGIIIAVATVQRPVILIDEPEAFLHPPQAFLIGQAIAQLRDRGRQIFVATHSAEVLRGILSATSEVSVIRFAQRDSVFKTNTLDSKDLQRIVADPVLSSARVLDGLFYNGVAITESDGDIVLYRSVLTQIDLSASIHFVNSYSKQVSYKVATPFGAMGVPCAVVVDFDMLRVRHEFKALFEALGGAWTSIEDAYDSLVDEAEGNDNAANRLDEIGRILGEIQTGFGKQGTPDQGLTWVRARLKEVREAAVIWKNLKQRGVDGLPVGAKQSFFKIDQACRHLGLFIAAAGQREAWLVPDVPYSSNKNRWTEDALRFLGANKLPEKHRLRTFVEDVRKCCLGNPT